MAFALMAVWLASMVPLVLHNDVLPYRYHADERTKAEQIFHDVRNFHHPLMMVETVQLAWRWWPGGEGSSGTPSVVLQHIVVIGRYVSAAFAAIAVAALALTAYWMRGWWAMACVGLVTGMSHSLLIYAHDFKEDTALVMGLALVLAALAACYRYRNLLSIVALGAACALAASGKYVGIVGLVAALPLVWTLTMPRARRWRMVVLLLAFVAVLLLVNHRVLTDWSSFAKSFSFEARHGVTNHDGVTTGLPNVYWLRQWWREVTLPVALLAGLHIARTLATWRHRSPMERVVALAPVAYLALLVALCPLPFNRYLLPVMVLTHVVAGLGILDAARLLAKVTSPRSTDDTAGGRSGPNAWAVLSRLVVPLLLLVVVTRQVPLMADYLQQIPDDSRRRLDSWLRHESAGGMRILSDFTTGLQLGIITPAPHSRGSASIVLNTGLFAAEWGSLDNVRRLGITHVAICELAYDRYTSGMTYATPQKSGEFEARRAFYQELLDHGQIVWDSHANATHTPTGSYTNPRVVLVKLPPIGG